MAHAHAPVVSSIDDQVIKASCLPFMCKMLTPTSGALFCVSTVKQLMES